MRRAGEALRVRVAAGDLPASFNNQPINEASDCHTVLKCTFGR
jgi:hypothetical protein